MTTEAEQKLAEFLSNPNLDASSPEYLAALSEVMGVPPENPEDADDPDGAERVVVAAKDAPAKPEEPGTTATDAKAPDAAAGTEGEGEPPPVIKSKDGRREIPYSELETARQQLAEALQKSQESEAMARQLADMVATMQAAIEERRPEARGGEITTPVDGDFAGKIEEVQASMAKIEEEFPDLAPHLKPWHAMIEQQTRVLAHLEQQRIEQERAEAQARAAAVQANLQQVPALTHWMKNNREVFEEAKVQDRLLRANPEWKDKPEVERFAKVVEVMVALRGPKILDGVPNQSPAKTDKAAPVAPAAPVKPATPDAVLAKALGIASLSDLPGGAPVAADPTDPESMSVEQLAQAFARTKTDGELFAMLGRLGATR